MRVSVIIPACDAQSTLERAINSLFAQTWPNWEAIIVADDHFDYRAFLAGKGIADARLRFISTGKRRSGCHHARNIGFAEVSGDCVTQLDADDLLTPDRFSTLLPLVERHGAAADNLVCQSESTGKTLYRVLGEADETRMVDVDGFFELTAPLVPVIRRDHAQSRIEGVELAEDVIANLRLIDRIGALPVVPGSSYVYRIVEGSICHDADSDRRFDEAYASYVARIETGDAFGLSPAIRRAAIDGLNRKRDLNRAFSDAVRRDPALTFQDFVSQRVPAGNGPSSPLAQA